MATGSPPGSTADYATNSAKAYLYAGPQERRLLDEAFFTRILVRDDDIEAEFAEPFKILLSSELADESRTDVKLSSVETEERRVGAFSLKKVVANENKQPATGGQV